MDYGAIRTGLARRLEEIDTLVAVWATVPDSVVTPSAAVLPGDPFVEYHASMSDGSDRGLILLRFDVIVFAARFDAVGGQGVLDELAGTIPAVLEDDPTLGGEAMVTVVREGSNYGVVTVADSTLLGCRFAVEVYAR